MCSTPPNGRVLHLIGTGGPGGAETVFSDLCDGLSHLGWPSVPVIPSRDWLASDLERRGHQPRVVPMTSTHDLTLVLRLVRLVRRERIDLIHAHLLGSAVYGGLAGLLTGTPVVCTFHGRPDIRASDRLLPLKKWILSRRRAFLVCVSDDLRSHFRNEGLLPGTPRVIWNGLPSRTRPAPTDQGNLRTELSIPAGAPLIGAVGNLRKAKDYPTLVRAFARVQGTDVPPHLVIAGHYDPQSMLYQDLIALASDLGVSHRTHLLGFRSDVEAILEDIDVFVLSSSDEGFSLATVQAMALGRPMVLTRSGGPEEIVGDSESAVFVQPRNEAQLADGMTAIATDPSLARELAARARARAREFSLERTLSAYSSLYSEALESGRSRRQNTPNPLPNAAARKF